MIKRGSFDARVAKCLAQFQEVETRSTDRGQRLEIDSRVARGSAAASGRPRTKVKP
jgi:hypothetical protein